MYKKSFIPSFDSNNNTQNYLTRYGNSNAILYYTMFYKHSDPNFSYKLTTIINYRNEINA